MKLTDLSNETLLSNLHSLVGQGRALLSRLLAYLGEVEERRLHLFSACSSMVEFCVRKLGMSEDEAWRRFAVSRVARRFPIVLGMVERGEIHLTALLLLREYLTPDNHEELLRAASGKTKAQVLELIAARFPRPGPPSSIQELPAQIASSSSAGAATAPNRIAPLSAERYSVQLTASAELKAKIERARNLMRHENPSGDLTRIVERAIDLLIEDLERKRLGKTKHPRPKKTRGSAQSPCSVKI